jgi:hypothetical protein
MPRTILEGCKCFGHKHIIIILLKHSNLDKFQQVKCVC